MDKKPYYISTAIAYTSAKPHIGNTYAVSYTHLFYGALRAPVLCRSRSAAVTERQNWCESVNFTTRTGGRIFPSARFFYQAVCWTAFKGGKSP